MWVKYYIFSKRLFPAKKKHIYFRYISIKHKQISLSEKKVLQELIAVILTAKMYPHCLGIQCNLT